MKLERSEIIKLAGGGLIGALLGASVAWLLIKAPSALPEGEEPEPITPGELITLTGAAATLINRLNNLRHKM